MIESGTAQLVWLALFGGLIATWAITLFLTRRTQHGRMGKVLLAAFIVLAIATGSTTGFVWGSEVALEGTRLLKGKDDAPGGSDSGFIRLRNYLSGKSAPSSPAAAEPGNGEPDPTAKDEKPAVRTADDGEKRIQAAAAMRLEFVRFAAPTGSGDFSTIGFSPEAVLQLPDTYQLAERATKGDLLEISGIDRDKLAIRKKSGARSTVLILPGPADQYLDAADRKPGNHFDPKDPNGNMRAAKDLMMNPDRTTRCLTEDEWKDKLERLGGAPDAASGSQSVTVLLCDSAAERESPLALRAILEIERSPGWNTADVASQAADAQGSWFRVRPYLVENNEPLIHKITISSNEPIGLGSTYGAIPGLMVWEVPSPPGIQNVVFPPDDLLGECSDWLKNNRSGGGGFIIVDSLADDDIPQLRNGESICPPFNADPFVFQVRRLLPDRNLLTGLLRASSFLLLLPMLLLLTWFAFSDEKIRGPRNALTVMGVGVLSVGLNAIMAIRLTWAHRIDMMKFFDPVSLRTLTNEASVVSIAAMLGALAWIIAVEMTGARNQRTFAARHQWIRAVGAVVVWLLVVALGLVTFQPDRDSHVGILEKVQTTYQFVFSFLVTAVILCWRPLWNWMNGINGKKDPAVGGSTEDEPRGCSKIGAWFRCNRDLILAAFFFAGLIAAGIGLRAIGTARTPAVLKIALGWITPLLFYILGRRMIFRKRGGTVVDSWRSIIVYGAIIILLPVILFMVDRGVSFAFLGMGGLAALVLLGLDLGRDSLEQSLGRDQRQSYLLAGVIVAGLCALIVVLKITSGYADGESAGLPRALTESMPAVVVGFLCVASIFVFILTYTPGVVPRRNRKKRNMVVAGISAAVFIVCLALTLTMGQSLKAYLMKRDDTASQRISAVVEPAHLLLFNSKAFNNNVGAWNATTLDIKDVKNSAGLVKRDGGLGYFGAQIVNQGIRHSVENDYFPILLVQEAGTNGLLRIVAVMLLLVVAVAVAGAGRFVPGSAGSSARMLFAATLFLMLLYQPLASLGILPLTGISLPGMGIDSFGDLWPLVTLLVFALALDEREPRPLPDSDREPAKTATTHKRTIVIAGIVLTVACALCYSIIRTSTQFAVSRTAPYDRDKKHWNEPFERINEVFDFVLGIQSQFSRNDAGRLSNCEISNNGERISCDVPPEDGDVVLPEIIGLDRFVADNAILANYNEKFAGLWNASSVSVSNRIHRYIRAGVDGECKDAACLDALCRSFNGSLGETREKAGAVDESVQSALKEKWPSAHWVMSPEKVDEKPACRFNFKVGWPEVRITVTSDGKDRFATLTEVDQSDELLATLGVYDNKPFRNTRVRVVSKAMGDAALDIAEVIGQNQVARLRPGEHKTVDLSLGDTGYFHGREIQLADGLKLTVGADGRSPEIVAVPGGGEKAAVDTTIKLVSLSRPPDTVRQYDAGAQRWTVSTVDRKESAAPHVISGLTMIVAASRNGPRLWMIRPASAWGAGDDRVVVDPLIADDVTNVLKGKRRYYVYGAQLPELGWFSRFNSLGLDGWIHRALAEVEAPNVQFAVDSADRNARLGKTESDIRAARTAFQEGFCGTLTPPVEEATVTDDPFRQLEPVCTRSKLDGVLECRVSIQPELQLQLRHVLELTAQRPELMPYAGGPAVSAGLALLKGDTGEILAQHSFVTGRETSLLAPRTPQLEQRLIAELDRRNDQEGGEKTEWNNPIAIGSTMKPLLARAVEWVAPDITRNLKIAKGGDWHNAPCDFGNMFGHCVPAAATWLEPGTAISDFYNYIANSENFFQAGLGLMMTGVGANGALYLGDLPAGGRTMTDREFMKKPVVLLHKDLERRLWTMQGGKLVIGSNGRIDLDAIRTGPAWQQFENLLGRPLCNFGDKANCMEKWALKDLCAARALPIPSPTSALKNTVATGNGAFDFSNDDRRKPNPDTQPFSIVKEYLQFLRGAGKHRPVTMIQLADAFNRLFFDRTEPVAAAGDRYGPAKYSLAASWFPVSSPATFGIPENKCTREFAGSTGNRQTVRHGVCGVFAAGTATKMIGLSLDWPDVDIYGGKTGTPQSLGSYAESRRSCRNFNIQHTVDAENQPHDQYYIKGCRNGGVAPDDNLFVVGMGVHDKAAVVDQKAGVVPLTMAVGYTGVQVSGYAVKASEYLMQIVINYFNGVADDLPARPSASPSKGRTRGAKPSAHL